MKTYKIKPETVLSLRRSMIIGTFGVTMVASILGVSGIARIGFGEALILGSIVMYATTAAAVWKLWEWAGMGLWLAVVVASVLLHNVAVIIEIGFFCFVFYSLGRQRPDAPPEREVLGEQPTPADNQGKTCPFCAETIKSEAKLCRFCGRDQSATAAS